MNDEKGSATGELTIPMSDDEFRDRLQDFVDDELGPAERAAMEAHMRQSPEAARLYRQVSKFTTTLVKTMQPLRGSEDFASKVLQKFEESKTDLTRVPESKSKIPAAPRTIPAWPFAAGIGLAFLLAVVLLLTPKSAEPVALVTKGREAARLMEWDGSGWIEMQGDALANGGRVEAVTEPGAVIELRFNEAKARVSLLAPAMFQAKQHAQSLELLPIPETPGRLMIRTDRGKPASGLSKLRVAFNQSWVLLDLGEDNEVEIGPGERMELRVSVRRGSVQAGNSTERENIAEGFARTVPQSGALSPATEADPENFAWVK